jgi:DNA polymerase III gamma/tau subunit
MVKDNFHFTHANILYGSAHAQKQASIDAFQSTQNVRIVHVFGEDKGIGINEAHEIRRRAYLATGEGKQIFIIWRADEMTTEATQVFLKILEEPPRGAVFFLLARALVLPATILSRASRFAFFGAEMQQDGDSKAEIFFTEEITRLKHELEEKIIQTKQMPSRLVYKLNTLVRLESQLYSSRISPKYLMDSYTILH